MRQKPSKKDTKRQMKLKQKKKKKQVAPASVSFSAEPTETEISNVPKSEVMDVDALAEAINSAAAKQEVKDEPSDGSRFPLWL